MPKGPGIASSRKAQARLGVAMSMPAVILSAVFILFPLVAAVYLAFTNWNGLSATYGPFTGLANIRGLLDDSVLWAAVVNNLAWIVAGTLAPLIISLILAVLLWAKTWGATLYRLVFLLPYIIPTVTIGIVWSWIYDPTNGWANRLLGDVGLGVLQRSWLSDPATVLYCALFAAIWGATGFCTVVLSAALQQREPRPHRFLAGRRCQRGTTALARHSSPDRSGVHNAHHLPVDRRLQRVRRHFRNDTGWSR